MTTKRFSFIFLSVLASLFVLPAMAANVWHVPRDFRYIQEAVTAATSGDRIIVGLYTGPGALIDKTVEITGSGAATIIDSPATSTQTPKAAFYIPSGALASATRISHLTITGGVTCPIGVYAEAQNDITLDHLVITNIQQGITNHGGSGWQVTHNKIVGLIAYPGGIQQVFGVLISGNKGPDGKWCSSVEDNLVAFNDIDGTNTDRYIDSGKRLYCPNRFGIRLNPHGVTACYVQENKVVHNKAVITKLPDTPEIYAVGIALTNSSRNKPPPNPEICPTSTPDTYLPRGINNNTVEFNDLRGSEMGIGTYPPCNDLYILSENHPAGSDNPNVSRNFGGTYVLRTVGGKDVPVLIDAGENRGIK